MTNLHRVFFCSTSQAHTPFCCINTGWGTCSVLPFLIFLCFSSSSNSLSDTPYLELLSLPFWLLSHNLPNSGSSLLDRILPTLTRSELYAHFGAMTLFEARVYFTLSISYPSLS